MEKTMAADLESIIYEHQQPGVDQQIDPDKFYLYSLITYSTPLPKTGIPASPGGGCSRRS